MNVKWIVLCISSVVWILLFEVAAHQWIERVGDPLDRSMAVLQMDADVGWRQKANFRGTFLDTPLETNEIGLRNTPLSLLRDATKRILVLGPSSTFGWGVVEAATYARQLERQLRQRLPDTPVQVINAGEIGFSSWQGVEFYRKVLRDLQPDLVVIAYGANDVDRHRFFFDDPLPDRLALSRARSSSAVAWQNAVGRLQFVHVARRALVRLTSRFACLMGSGMEQAEHAIVSLRVPPSDFIDNLHVLIALAQQDGAGVILMNTGFLLPQFPLVAEQRLEQSRDLFAMGMKHLESRDASQAAEAFLGSLASNPHQCVAYYGLSFSLAALRDCNAARQASDAARANEPARVARDLRIYNRLVSALAAEVDIPFVDVQAILSDGPPEAMFLDPIHFTPEGHARLASALTDTILGAGLMN